MDKNDRSPSAKRLQQAREAHGFKSAREAANAEGGRWNYNSYAQHESGTRGITQAAATKYAIAFGVSPGWLLTGEGMGTSASSHIPKTKQANNLEAHQVSVDLPAWMADELDNRARRLAVMPQDLIKIWISERLG